jgi:hypothetical protein
MFWVGGDARVTLARLSARADVVLYAAGNAHVTLEDVKLIGREQAVNIAGYATVKAHAVALEGPKRVAASAKWESD